MLRSRRYCLCRIAVRAPQDMPKFRWENFTTANGLPDNHVFCVLVDGDRIWAGTDNGLGLYENGHGKSFVPPMDSLIRPCSRLPSTSIRAMSGREPWAG